MKHKFTKVNTGMGEKEAQCAFSENYNKKEVM